MLDSVCNIHLPLANVGYVLSAGCKSAKRLYKRSWVKRGRLLNCEKGKRRRRVNECRSKISSRSASLLVVTKIGVVILSPPKLINNACTWYLPTKWSRNFFSCRCASSETSSVRLTRYWLSCDCSLRRTLGRTLGTLGRLLGWAVEVWPVLLLHSRRPRWARSPARAVGRLRPRWALLTWGLRSLRR